MSPLASTLGFARLPLGFFSPLAGMVVGYLVLIELAKRLFFSDPEGRMPLPHPRRRGEQHRVERRAARFSVGSPLSC
jgi:Mg2+-importing ATPase